VRWAAENRREELVELKGEGLITKDNVGKWMTLMREWQEESEKEVEKLDLLNVPPDSKIDANSTTQR
jgi:hypothetical protein